MTLDVTVAETITAVEVTDGDISVVEVTIPGAQGSGTGGGSSDFLGLTDTPDSYAGQAARVVAVNAGETALEFVGAGAASQTPWTQDIDADGNDLTDLGYIDFREIALPSAPAANFGRLFVRDNGSGVTQLCMRFANGNVLVIGQDT